MIKRACCIAFFLFLFLTGHSQFDTVFAKTNIRHCADSLAWGFKTKNWEVYTRYSYPAIIGAFGGTKEFMSYMATIFEAVPDSAWKMYAPGKILQVVKTEGDLQAIVELRSVLEWQGRKITTVSHLVGESWDGGLFWRFFDSEGDRSKALVVKPDLSEQLIIPQKKETIEPVSPQLKGKQNQ